ncbi:MAG TPA: hypothetical protein VK133_02130 [Amoebophilaceae bacterium]|jgi:hypothetical protein|nr:hypothetical protein [Amoebophilaceae bacterium]
MKEIALDFSHGISKEFLTFSFIVVQRMHALDFDIFALIQTDQKSSAD